MRENRQQSGERARKFVADELGEKGYFVSDEVKYTTLLVTSPSGKKFNLKVTSLSSPNAWIVSNPENYATHFALVLQPNGGKSSLFIMSSDEMQAERDEYIKSRKKPVEHYSNPKLERQSLRFDQALPYENKWSSLPE